MAQRTSLPFAYSAEDDGVVLDINVSSEMIKLKYNDGRLICLHYGQEYSNNSGHGFYATQNIVLNNIKTGSKFKKGDVLVYNENFFTPDPYSTQVNWNMGKLINVAIMECDNTMEDSTAISTELSKALDFNPVHIRTISLNNTTNVHQIADIGTEVSSIDKLLTFDESPLDDSFLGKADEATIELLNKMNRSTPKAKYDGKIVNIELFYKCRDEELSDSIATLVKKYNGRYNKKAKYAKSADNAHEFPPLLNITDMARLGNDVLDDNTVLIKFYIQDELSANRGDKIVIDSSLKSVISNVMSDDVIDEDGNKIDALFSALSISNRIICSPLLTGFTNRILEKVENEILDIWNG